MIHAKGLNATNFAIKKLITAAQPAVININAVSLMKSWKMNAVVTAETTAKLPICVAA